MWSEEMAAMVRKVTDNCINELRYIIMKMSSEKSTRNTKAATH